MLSCGGRQAGRRCSTVVVQYSMHASQEINSQLLKELESDVQPASESYILDIDKYETCVGALL